MKLSCWIIRLTRYTITLMIDFCVIHKNPNKIVINMRGNSGSIIAS